jgi:hypothetical protein
MAFHLFTDPSTNHRSRYPRFTDIKRDSRVFSLELQFVRQISAGSNIPFFTLMLVLQENWADNMIMGHEIHEKLEDRVEGKWLKFVRTFCEEMFSHNFDKCLGQLKATFDPSQQENYPPFFDVTKHITCVEVSKMMAQEIPFLNRFIGAPETSGTIIEPIPDIQTKNNFWRLSILSELRVQF